MIFWGFVFIFIGVLVSSFLRVPIWIPVFLCFLNFVLFLLKTKFKKVFFLIFSLFLGVSLGIDAFRVKENSLFFTGRVKTNFNVCLKSFVEYGKAIGTVNGEKIKLSFYTDDSSYESLLIGDRLSVSGTFKGGKFLGKYGNFLLRKGVVGKFNVYKFKLLSRHCGVFPVVKKFLVYVVSQLKSLPEQSDLALGLILGKKEIDFKKSKKYSFAGVNHILAVSGLHTGYIFMILWGVFSFLRLPKKLKWLLIVLGVFFYALAVGLKVSVVRAWLMIVSVVFFQVFLGRKIQTVESISVAGIVILLLNPLSAFDVGFQLSFLATISIVSFSPTVSLILNRWIRLGWLRDSLSVSFSAWFGTAPVVMYYFHKVNPTSVFINIFVVPLTGVVVLSLILYLFLGLVPVVQPLFKVVAVGFLNFLDNSVSVFYRATHHLLLSSYNSRKLWIFVVFYSAVVLWFVFWYVRSRRRVLKFLSDETELHSSGGGGGPGLGG